MPENTPEQPKPTKALRSPTHPNDLSRLGRETFDANEADMAASKIRKREELIPIIKKPFGEEIKNINNIDKGAFFISRSGTRFPATDQGYTDMKAENDAFWERQKNPKQPIK